MAQAKEKTSRFENTLERTVNGPSVSNMKFEVNHEQSPGFFTPNVDIMELKPITVEPLQMVQDFVGDNGFSGDIENTETNKRKRSEAWKDFTAEKKSDGSTGARCKHCNLVLTGNKNSGTSHLLRHVKLHCPSKPYGNNIKIVTPSSPKKRSSDFGGFEFNQEISRKYFAHFLICAGLPFKIVEHPAFVTFVKGLQPSFQFVSQEAVRSDCIVLYEEERKKIHNMLKNLNSRLSFSFDLWTSDEDVVYFAITAHFIDDDFLLKKKVLNFRRITYSPTPNMINDEIAKCIAEWGLDKKVFALTCDNYSINDILARRFGENCIDDLAVIGNYINVRSCEHVLNIMAQDGINILNCTIERVRNLLIYAATTQPHMQVFNEIAQECGLGTKEGLAIDVSRKWNATYDMLQSALSYKEAISKYVQLYYYGMDAPSNDDWEKIEVLTNILKVFVNANDVFSKTKHPTANLYFKEVWTIRSLLHDEFATCDEVIRTLTLKMQQIFKNYWNEYNMILAIASILDPRSKFLFIQFCYENAFDKDKAKQNLNETHDYLYKLYNDYEEAANHEKSDYSNLQGLGSTSEHMGKKKIETEFAKFLSKKVLRRTKKDELDAYLDDEILLAVEDEEFNVLNWWRINAEIYPILSKMAKDVLAIPISNFACKSAFSACKKLIDQHNTDLDRSMVEHMICAQDWLHHDYSLGEELFESGLAG